MRRQILALVLVLTQWTLLANSESYPGKSSTPAKKYSSSSQQHAINSRYEQGKSFKRPSSHHRDRDITTNLIDHSSSSEPAPHIQKSFNKRMGHRRFRGPQSHRRGPSFEGHRRNSVYDYEDSFPTSGRRRGTKQSPSKRKSKRRSESDRKRKNGKKGRAQKRKERWSALKELREMLEPYGLVPARFRRRPSKTRRTRRNQETAQSWRRSSDDISQTRRKWEEAAEKAAEEGKGRVIFSTIPQGRRRPTRRRGSSATTVAVKDPGNRTKREHQPGIENPDRSDRVGTEDLENLVGVDQETKNEGKEKGTPVPEGQNHEQKLKFSLGEEDKIKVTHQLASGRLPFDPERLLGTPQTSGQSSKSKAKDTKTNSDGTGVWVAPTSPEARAINDSPSP